ncbi:MAG: succinate dehydrogenase, hydrophobic membrane anchor protein [Gammaproteobacteria bacterium]|nr:succinate dehydrogenase, hydrophobic membrane anchor protein [Gammaproteobacteria bacterium]NND58641.1 succinate dehydrogenase, hydrophobic membrane anchor protein [Gammaproteobacteria bacterium]
MSRRTALGHVLGLGSAKDGTGHWWAQRVSAVAMVPLGLWFLFSVALLIGRGTVDYLSVIDWIASPVNAVALILLIATMCYHSALGVQVVIEDYVHGGTKVVSLVLQKFAHAVLAAAGIFAVLRIALGS